MKCLYVFTQSPEIHMTECLSTMFVYIKNVSNRPLAHDVRTVILEDKVKVSLFNRANNSIIYKHKNKNLNLSPKMAVLTSCGKGLLKLLNIRQVKSIYPTALGMHVFG